MNVKSPQLKDLIRLAFPEPVIWLSHEAQSKSRPVNWVSTSIEESQPDDVLLMPSVTFNEALLEDARQKGVCALLLLGGLPAEDLPHEGEFSIAVLPEQPAGEIREAQRLMLTILVNQRAALIERGARIHAQLSQLEAEGKGLEGLARAMSEISGRGVLVQDKRGRILAQHPSSTLTAIWLDVLEQLDSLESLPGFLMDRKHAGGPGSITIQKIPGGLERIITPITVGGVARGYLSLLGLQGETDELDHLVAEQGSLVCAVEMARNKAVREAEKRLKGDLLTALLQDSLSPRDTRLWAQAMELDLAQPHVALRFAWDHPSAPSRRRLETLINGEVSRLGLRVIASPMGAEVVCFCQLSPQPKRPEPAILLGEAVLDQGAREYPNSPGRCGIGAVAQDIEEWRTSFRQAGQALELARRLGERKPMYYPDLSVYRLLFQLEHSPELIAFQEETLGPLLAYEAAEELIHTLEAYFEHNANLSQTAEALYMHRNTLIYRMERIAAITNLDLDEPENRLAIQLALRIFRMMGKKRG
jgi:purine catabolism regulator